MTISVEMLAAFVSGFIVPIIVALFGREALGKLLLGKQRREDTALTAILDLVTKSVDGWREATAANMALSGVMERSNALMANHDRSLGQALTDFDRVMERSAEAANNSFTEMNQKLDTLITILAGDS